LKRVPEIRSAFPAVRGLQNTLALPASVAFGSVWAGFGRSFSLCECAGEGWISQI